MSETAEPSVAQPKRGRGLKPSAAFQLGFFVALGVLTAWGLVNVLVSLQGILLVVVVALFVALGLQPVIDRLMRLKVPRTVAVLMVVLGLVGVLALVVAALVPLVIEQATMIVDQAPYWLHRLRDNEQIAQLDNQFQIISKITAMIASGSWVTAAFGGVMGATSAAANVVFNVFMTIILASYFTWMAPSIKSAIYQLSPKSRRPRVKYLVDEVIERIGDYIIAMLVVLALWGVGTFIVLNSVGLAKYSLALALLVMCLVVIPAVGSTVGGVICTLVALSVSPTAAIITAAYFVIYQALDAYVVQPRLFARSLDVPPVLVILGATCGILILGIVGAVIAVPTVASLLLLYREVLVPKLDSA